MLTKHPNPSRALRASSIMARDDHFRFDLSLLSQAHPSTSLNSDEYHKSTIFDALLDLLWALDGIQQDPRHHPEGDALFHSLQVFVHAQNNTDDPILWAAALLHDVGKAEGTQGHAARGATWLEPWMPAPVVWLVHHHMDLLIAPRKTRQRLHLDPRLPQLEALRRFDRAGRDPQAVVPEPEEALKWLLDRWA